MEPLKEYNPQMHSAEHILNQTMVRMFGCERSFNNHIEKKKSKCDFHFPHPLSESETQELEKRVNDVIKSALQVTATSHSADDAVKLFNLKKIPDDQRETIRIIHIGNYDSCPCIGQHVGNTADIINFRIISSSWENDVLRIRFKAGDHQK
jgi:misacylated tRNA(Ala) deacylase